MPHSLPRLKPDPIPQIAPVPEHSAKGRLAEVYDRTKRGLSVPWMGVVAMAFARYPAFFDRLWTALEPVAASSVFDEACASLLTQAEAEAWALEPSGITARLLDIGYAPAELDEIRACNAVFSPGNMPYLLMAALARLLLEGQEWTGQGPLPPKGPMGAAQPPRPALMEPHHADPALSAIYADLRQVLGLPFVNTDYRAFARWPSYFALAWPDLKTAIQRPDYETRVTRVHEASVSIALSLPNVTGLTARDLQEAAANDSSVAEVLAVVRLFQWLLPGLAVNVGFLRHQLKD